MAENTGKVNRKVKLKQLPIDVLEVPLDTLQMHVRDYEELSKKRGGIVGNGATAISLFCALIGTDFRPMLGLSATEVRYAVLFVLCICVYNFLKDIRFVFEHRGETVKTMVYGMAGISEKKPNTADTDKFKDF